MVDRTTHRDRYFPATTEAPALVPELHPLVHVVGRFYPSDRSGVFRSPDLSQFPARARPLTQVRASARMTVFAPDGRLPKDKQRIQSDRQNPKVTRHSLRISPYEDRRLGYPRLTIRQNSERLSTVWHRLPADSLTSPPIPVEVGPFIVELFTVGCLIRSPRLSAPVWSVARLTAPHVSTVERTRHDSKPMSPRDGIWQSIATPASFRTTQHQRRRFRQLIAEHVRLARIPY